MNPLNTYRQTGLALLLGGTIAFLSVIPLHAAATNQVAVSTSATNAPAPVNTNDFRSIFDSTGRDPFFPNSARQAMESAAGGENQPAIVLVLKGFSGPAHRRFAIINDRTFAVGDESEVRTSGGRIRIRCVEIRDTVAVVTIGSNGQRIELRLPSRF